RDLRPAIPGRSGRRRGCHGRRGVDLPDAHRLSGMSGDMSGHDGGASVGPGEEVRLSAPLQGTVVLLPVPIGGAVAVGTIVVVLESMKMEHVVRTPVAGTLTYLDVDVGGLVADGA